jgi:MFS superfamily sulfate permease-like transporter
MNPATSKLLRNLLTCSLLIVGCLYIGVLFLGEDWSSQVQYLLRIGQMLLAIVLCAALLVAVFKLIAYGWSKLLDRQSQHLNQHDNEHDD